MHIWLRPCFCSSNIEEEDETLQIDSVQHRRDAWLLKQVNYLSSSPCRRRQPRHGCRGLACRRPWLSPPSLNLSTTPVPLSCRNNACGISCWFFLARSIDRPAPVAVDTSRTYVCAPMAVPAGQWLGEGIGAEETIYRQGAPARKRSSATLSISIDGK